MGSTAEQTTNGMPDYSSIKKEGLFRQTWNGLRRNRLAMFGLALIVILVLIAVFADFIAPFGVDEQDLTGKFLKPGGRHLFGTDEFGRDIFSRIVYGSRYSLMIGAVAATLSAVIGMIAGSLAGFYGGRTDNILMRLIDIMLAIPSTLLGISIVAALGNGIRNVIIAVAIGAVPAYARIVRASILSVKEQEYIEAARSIGASDFRIIMKHIKLPGPDYRPDYDERGQGNPGGIGPQLYRTGCPAAVGGMGGHALGRPCLHKKGMVDCHLPGACHCHDYFRTESVRGRSEGRPGSQT